MNGLERSRPGAAAAAQAVGIAPGDPGIAAHSAPSALKAIYTRTGFVSIPPMGDTTAQRVGVPARRAPWRRGCAKRAAHCCAMLNALLYRATFRPRALVHKICRI
jgi:hypothetical protein